MAKKISKRTREQAAMICAIAASNDVNQPYVDVVETVGMRVSDQAMDLAIKAHAKVIYSLVPDRDGADAEAEALIRTGWSP